MKKGILIIAVCLLAASCVEEGGTGPKPTYPKATSPVNCLKRVEMSFNQREMGIMVDVLSDNFVFYFDPDDVGQHPPGLPNYEIPETWSCAQFKGAVTNMYRKAFSISLTIPTGGVGTPEPNATAYKADNVNIKLLVMIDELNGYLADQGYCNFQFERYDGNEGEKLWRLTKWWDNTAMQYDANPALKPTSVGRILAMYE